LVALEGLEGPPYVKDFPRGAEKTLFSKKLLKRLLKSKGNRHETLKKQKGEKSKKEEASPLSRNGSDIT